MCGFVYTVPTAAEVWTTLQRVDSLIEQSRYPVHAHDRGVPPVPSSPLNTPGAAGMHPDPEATSPPLVSDPLSAVGARVGGTQHSPRAARPRVDVGSVLLGLGALSILVAATIFISVSWDQLGLFGRSMVLLLVTIVATAAALVVTRRRLTGSAEALWAIVIGLVSIDWFAAWEQDLLSIGSSPLASYTALWTVIVTGGCLALNVLTAPVLGRRLWVPQIVAAMLPWVGLAALWIELSSWPDWSGFWALTVATTIPLAVAVTARRLSEPIVEISAFAATALAAAAMLVEAMARLTEAPTFAGAFLDGGVIPLVVVTALSVLAGYRFALLAPLGGFVAVASVVFLSVTISYGESGTRLAICVLAVTLVALVSTLTPSGSWQLGARVATAVLALVVLAVVATTLVLLLESVSESIGRTEVDFWASPPAWVVENFVGPWWVHAIVLGCVASAGWLMQRWKPQFIPPNVYREAATVVVAVGVPAVVAVAGLPYAVLAGVIIVVGSLATVGLWRQSHWAQTVGPAVVVFAVVPSSINELLLFVVAAAVSFFLATVAWKTAHHAIGSVTVFGSVVTGLVSANSLVNFLEVDPRVNSLVLTVICLSAFGVACWIADRTWLRVSLECAGGAGAVVAIVGFALAQNGATWASLCLALVAVALLGAAADLEDRRWYAMLGAALGVIAWFLMLVGSGFNHVEAYTVPIAALAIAVGVVWMRRQPSMGSIAALGLGLTLALGPSLPQALADPTSLRALLLGLASAVVLGFGAAWSWKAPFVSGSVVLVLLVLVNLWPVAMSVHRWVLFAVLGLLLLGVGITWEERVKQGKAVIRFVARMR